LAYVDLIFYLFNFYSKLITNGEEIEEPFFYIYEQLMCILWNSIFYILLAKANYNQKYFTAYLQKFISLEKLDELTEEGGK
jgi:hypothetical protein